MACSRIGLAPVDVTATVFVMNDGGRFHRQHLLAEAPVTLLSFCAAAAPPTSTTRSWPPPSPRLPGHQLNERYARLDDAVRALRRPASCAADP
jgi:hypothetical protein